MRLPGNIDLPLLCNDGHADLGRPFVAIVRRMWHLKMADGGASWVTLGSFGTVASAAQKIIELEGYPVSGVFLKS